VIAVQFALILCLAYVAATCHVTFRDTQYILELALYLLFFLTPVLYDSRFVSERFRPIYQLNPMAQLLDSYRRILLEGQWPNPRALLSVAFATVILLAVTHTFFSRASQRFVDEL
jgi:lipopolysaccharide transport system permease protein